MDKLAKRIRRVSIAVLLSLMTIGTTLVSPPTNAFGTKPGNPKLEQSEKDRVSAQAKQDVNLCQQLQPCVGNKLESIDTTLHDISTLVATMAFADNAPGTFTNKNNDCRRDTHNAFYNNTAPGAVAKDVSFFIKNSGSCPVEISVSAMRGGANVGGTQDIPANNNDGQGERTGFPVPAGTFLRAKCKDAGTCKYVFTDVKP